MSIELSTEPHHDHRQSFTIYSQLTVWKSISCSKTQITCLGKQATCKRNDKYIVNDWTLSNILSTALVRNSPTLDLNENCYLIISNHATTQASSRELYIWKRTVLRLIFTSSSLWSRYTCMVENKCMCVNISDQYFRARHLLQGTIKKASAKLQCAFLHDLVSHQIFLGFAIFSCRYLRKFNALLFDISSLISLYEKQCCIGASSVEMLSKCK